MEISNYYRQLKKIFWHSKVVFIMGHKDLDLDALGSSLGMYAILSKQKKKCFLVIDDKNLEAGVAKMLGEVKQKVNIIKSKEVMMKTHRSLKKNLLLIVDTNKGALLPREELLQTFSNILVIDHHQTNSQSIQKGLVIIDEQASSTCEMITELLERYQVDIDDELATILLSGIVLDTNNFAIRTGERAYYTAYYLTKHGASPKKVQYLLKQDIKQYKEQQKVITEAEIVDQCIAISQGLDDVCYRREDLAKIADTLLLFTDMEASFVIGNLTKTTVGVSARSMGHIPVDDILEKIGGGGTDHEAAARLERTTVPEVKKQILKVLEQQKKGDKE